MLSVFQIFIASLMRLPDLSDSCIMTLAFSQRITWFSLQTVCCINLMKLFTESLKSFDWDIQKQSCGFFESQCIFRAQINAKKSVKIYYKNNITFHRLTTLYNIDWCRSWLTVNSCFVISENKCNTFVKLMCVVIHNAATYVLICLIPSKCPRDKLLSTYSTAV